MVVVRAITLDPNKVVHVGDWSVCKGGRLEMFSCIIVNPVMSNQDISHIKLAFPMFVRMVVEKSKAYCSRSLYFTLLLQ